ncbi:MAG: SGNH/GDSL hydrolase family protein [Promicromonosporaceae bacterium]|nr:SGNH/GDSL hydrolase family protein [Promicromonosporaceae bacterium]
MTSTTSQTRPTAPKWRSYIAIGDSFSEGMCDAYPSEAREPGSLAEHLGDDGEPGSDDGLQRGWADRLACSLSEHRRAAGLEPLAYANLAIRGRTLVPILEEQLPAALEQRPDLISIVGGGNDILRPGSDVDALCEKLEGAVAQARATGADVLMSTGFKAGGGLAWTRGRTGAYSSNIYAIARRHGAHVMDIWGMRSLFDLRLWAPDRLHLTEDGHRRVVSAALIALGLPPEDLDYDEPLPAQPAPALVEKAKADAEWARNYVAPWLKRRVTGTSSGDGREAKWPTLTPWPPPAEGE